MFYHFKFHQSLSDISNYIGSYRLIMNSTSWFSIRHFQTLFYDNEIFISDYAIGIALRIFTSFYFDRYHGCIKFTAKMCSKLNIHLRYYQKMKFVNLYGPVQVFVLLSSKCTNREIRKLL